MPKRNQFAARAYGRRPERRRGRTTRLWLQSLSTSTGADELGHASGRSFADDRDVWGFVRQLRGDEVVIAREISPRATHEVEIDYTTGCTPRKRFRVNGSTSRFLNIESVDNIENRNRVMVCLCQEEVTT